MDNREGTIVISLLTQMIDLHVMLRKYCLWLFFLSTVCIRNCISFDLEKYYDTSQIVIALSLLPIALYVSMIQHSIC